MFAPGPEALGTQLASDYGVNASLAVWAHALLNTNLYPLQPKPAWFERVSGNLEAARTTTRSWLNTEYSGIASALPQSLVDYGHTFVAAADQLIPYFSRPMTPADRRSALAILDELRSEAVMQQFRVRGLQKKVEAFSTFVMSTSATLSKDQRDVMASLKGASADVLKLQERITDLYRELGVTATEAKNAMSGAAMKGVSIAGTMMVYSMTVAVTAGTSLPVIGLAIGVLALTIGALQEKAHSESVLTKLREITQLQTKLSGEQVQAAALQAVAASIDSLSDVARMSMTNMAGTVHYWDDITSGLALAGEIVAQDSFDARTLTPFNTLGQAKAAWLKIIESAKNVQNSVFELHDPIRIEGTAA